MMEQIENRKNVSLCASLEALLFASGDGLTMDELTELLDVPSDIVEQTLKTLAARYKNDEDCGLLLTRKQSRYLLTTKLEVHEVLEKYYQNTPQVQLSRAAYETLAVIAYNEPCTRAQIEAVRGVNSDSALSKLVDYHLVEIKERLDAPGRPALYQCTNDFYRLFGLRDSNDLPARGFLMYDTLEDLRNQQKLLDQDSAD